MNLIKTETVKLKAKRAYIKKGTCSRTFLYILNREFGHPMGEEEMAVDPLAGGILQQGYQCGMLWGASLAVGAEAYRRFDDPNKATVVAILATRHLMESFKERTKSIECYDITNCDMTNKWNITKHFLKGKFFSCFKLAEKWAPEAVRAAIEGLSFDQSNFPESAISCASEVARRMGATEKEMVMVAGFAGGMGLSGNGCGALAAAIWMTTLELVRNEKQEWKYSIDDPINGKVLEAFYQTTNYEMECHNICGKQFDSVNEHTQFIRNGGCDKLIKELSQTMIN